MICEVNPWWIQDAVIINSAIFNRKNNWEGVVDGNNFRLMIMIKFYKLLVQIWFLTCMMAIKQNWRMLVSKKSPLKCPCSFRSWNTQIQYSRHCFLRCDQYDSILWFRVLVPSIQHLLAPFLWLPINASWISFNKPFSVPASILINFGQPSRSEIAS